MTFLYYKVQHFQKMPMGGYRGPYRAAVTKEKMNFLSKLEALYRILLDYVGFYRILSTD